MQFEELLQIWKQKFLLQQSNHYNIIKEKQQQSQNIDDFETIFKSKFDKKEQQELKYLEQLYQSLDEYDQIDLIITILLHSKRSKAQLYILSKYFENFVIFQNLRKTIKNFNFQCYIDLLNALEYEHIPSFKYIFHVGDKGRKMYIIIDGEVGILFPKQEDEIDDKVKQKILQEKIKTNLGGSNDYKDLIKQNSPETKRMYRNSMQLKLKKAFEGKIEQLEDQKGENNANCKKIKDNITITNKQKQNIKKQMNDSQKLDYELNIQRQFMNQIDKKYPLMKLVNMVFPQNHFGEIALEHKLPRTASVITKSNCYFATISYEKYQIFINQFIRQQQDDKVQFLKQLPLFNQWRNAGLEILYNNLETVEYNSNSLVYQEGELAQYIYIIKSGEVELFMHVDEENKEKVFNSHIYDDLYHQFQLNSQDYSRFQNNSKDMGIDLIKQINISNNKIKQQLEQQFRNQSEKNQDSDPTQMMNSVKNKVLIPVLCFTQNQNFGEFEILQELINNKNELNYKSLPLRVTRVVTKTMCVIKKIIINQFIDNLKNFGKTFENSPESLLFEQIKHFQLTQILQKNLNINKVNTHSDTEKQEEIQKVKNFQKNLKKNKKQKKIKKNLKKLKLLQNEFEPKEFNKLMSSGNENCIKSPRLENNKFIAKYQKTNFKKDPQAINNIISCSDPLKFYRPSAYSASFRLLQSLDQQLTQRFQGDQEKLNKNEVHQMYNRIKSNNKQDQQYKKYLKQKEKQAKEDRDKFFQQKLKSIQESSHQQSQNKDLKEEYVSQQQQILSSNKHHFISTEDYFEEIRKDKEIQNDPKKQQKQQLTQFQKYKSQQDIQQKKEDFNKQFNDKFALIQNKLKLKFSKSDLEINQSSQFQTYQQQNNPENCLKNVPYPEEIIKNQQKQFYKEKKYFQKFQKRINSQQDSFRSTTFATNPMTPLSLITTRTQYIPSNQQNNLPLKERTVFHEKSKTIGDYQYQKLNKLFNAYNEEDTQQPQHYFNSKRQHKILRKTLKTEIDPKILVQGVKQNYYNQIELSPNSKIILQTQTKQFQTEGFANQEYFKVFQNEQQQIQQQKQQQNQQFDMNLNLTPWEINQTLLRSAESL